MNRPVLLLFLAFVLLAWPSRFGLAQYYEIDSYYDAMMEEEALTETLDDFGLTLDSPELEGMDGGDIWSYIEGLRRAKASENNEQ